MIKYSVALLVLFCGFITLKTFHDDCTMTITEQAQEKATCQLLITCDHPIRLDISSVLFESESPNIYVTSWRLINTGHGSTHENKRLLTFQITTTPIPSELESLLVHVYFMEIGTKKPHHCTVKVPTNQPSEVLNSDEQTLDQKSTEDYSFTNQKIKKHLIKVLKAPLTGVHYIIALLLNILNMILASRLMLLILLIVLGFLLGLIPVLNLGPIILMVLVGKEKITLNRLYLSGAYGVGFIAAAILQLHYVLNKGKVIENSPLFTLLACFILILLAFKFFGKLPVLDKLKIPKLSYVPAGFFMGIIAWGLFFTVFNIVTPNMNSLLSLAVTNYFALMIIAGIGLFILTMGWCSYAFLQSINQTSWLQELSLMVGFLCIFQALALTCTLLPVYITGIGITGALIAQGLFYAWQTTKSPTQGIKKFRTCLCVYSFCIAFLIASKLTILALC